MSRYDRRSILKLIGLGAVAAGSGVAAKAAIGEPMTRTPMTGLDLGPSPASKTAAADQTPQAAAVVNDSSPWWLIAPYEANTKVALSDIRALQLSPSGAVFAFLVASNGQPFRVDICRHEGSSAAPAPIARSENFDLFVANEGDGEARTDREHGLAVVALADAIRSAEANDPRELSLLTMRERWTQFSKIELGPTLA